jgi:hypothetical protein
VNYSLVLQQIQENDIQSIPIHTTHHTITIRIEEESLLDFSILLSLFKVLDVSFLLNPRTSNPIATCHNIKETKMRQAFAVQPDINQSKELSLEELN